MRAPHLSCAAGMLALALLALPACRACAPASEEAPGAMPQGFSVPVDRDGKMVLAIDQPLLDRTKPDYVDADRRAWRLSTLVGAGSVGPNAVVEVEDAEGVRMVLARGADLDAGRELVLTVNRAGALRVGVTTGDDIFGAFHGRGGNRGRSGDPTRVREVRHIWLSSEG